MSIVREKSIFVQLTVAPGIFTATPLESQKKTYYHGKKHNRTEDVKLFKLFLPASGQCLGSGLLCWMEKEDDEETGHKTERQVDIETPSPG